MDFREIAQAFITSFAPSEEEKEIAEERLAVCSECPSAQPVLEIMRCVECGCVISKKIFSPRGPEACPLRRWKR